MASSSADAMAVSCVDTSKVEFTRAQLFDLYVIDRDARKATGFGFLPPQIAVVVEKAALLGMDALEIDGVNAAFSDLTNRDIQNYFDPPKEVPIAAADKEKSEISE